MQIKLKPDIAIIYYLIIMLWHVVYYFCCGITFDIEIPFINPLHIKNLILNIRLSDGRKYHNSFKLAKCIYEAALLNWSDHDYEFP